MLQFLVCKQIALMAKCFSFLAVFCLYAALSVPASAQVWENIELIGVGAKSLALGSSGVAFLADANAPHLNAAGLAGLNALQVNSLYTRLLNEVNYNTLAVAVPSRFGVFGFSAVIASLSDINLATSLVNGRPVSSGTAAYSSSQYNLSFAKHFDRFFFLNNLSVGTSAKYLVRNFSGLPASYEAQGSAAGFDLDLGLQWAINAALTLGLSQHNFLPRSLGGKLTWASGYTESIPTFTKLGAAYKFFAEKGLVSLDLDFYPTRSDYPIPLHGGVQYIPLPLLSLRAGYDENLASGGAANTVTKAGNFSGGLGLKVGNLIFDYAYHPYYQEEQSATHFFTISYSGQPFAVSAPLIISPLILPPATAELAKLTELVEPIISKEPFFYDLDQAANPAVRQLIKELAAQRYFKGFPDGTFRPHASLTNAQFITVIVRVKELPISSENNESYLGLRSGHWAIPFVRAAEGAGIIHDRPFNPNRMVTITEASNLLNKNFSLKRRVTAIINKSNVQKILTREELAMLLGEVEQIKTQRKK